MRINAKAFTYSNNKHKVSIVGFNTHRNKYDYINSVIHEAEHIKQAMLKYYNIKDEGEKTNEYVRKDEQTDPRPLFLYVSGWLHTL